MPSGLETGGWTLPAAVQVPASPGLQEEDTLSFPGHPLQVSVHLATRQDVPCFLQGLLHQDPRSSEHMTSSYILPPGPCLSPISSLTRGKGLERSQMCVLKVTVLGQLPPGDSVHTRRQPRRQSYRGQVGARSPAGLGKG